MAVNWREDELTPEQIEERGDIERSNRMVGIVVLIAMAVAVLLLLAAGGAFVQMGGGL